VETKFASKVIMFEETLEFRQAIITCYRKQKTITLQQKSSKGPNVGCCKGYYFYLNFMVTTCVMN